MDAVKSDVVQQQAQNFFTKGVTAFQRHNWDIAVDLLTQCVKLVPGFSKARKVLRDAQIARFRSERKGSFAMQVLDFKCKMLRVKIQGFLKAGKKETALFECEKLMAMNPLLADNVHLAIECAEACEMPDAALFTVEAAYENNPNDMDMLLRVADYYMQVGEYTKARDAYVKLNASRPMDQDILKKLKDAEARSTMKDGGWEEAAGKKGGFRELIRDKEKAAMLDAKNKQVAAGEDAEALIAEAKEKVEKEPGNLNLYRALARIYSQNKRYAEAIETLEAARKVNPTDPELDRNLTATKINFFNQEIEKLQAAGDENAVVEKMQERDQFIFDDLLDRVQRYPNDLRLHFELGQQYYKYEYYDDAISQFQISQRSPKDRLDSLYYIGMCFAKKGQPDMAVMQLETAYDSIDIMNDLKKQICYELGDLAEQAGDLTKAANYYKEVYVADIGFEDIQNRYMRVYQLVKGQQQG
ncbi:MAG: tetratricopeptide repeat protein [Kiritimatiellae bacterium]|nr:tetratricopeptide repeat protein [Kiritimatiellia bacterium]